MSDDIIYKDSTGTVRTVSTANPLPVSDTNSEDNLDVILGNVSGKRYINKMGERESMVVAAAGEDIWRGNELSPAGDQLIPTPSDSGEQMSLVSESGNDSAAGTGVQEVTIEYLDGSGNEVTMAYETNGTTAVALASDISFINDMYASRTGSNGVSADHIKIYKTATGTGHVYDMIAQGGNKSLVPHFKVPTGHCLAVLGWHAEEAQDKRINIRLRATATPSGDVNPAYLFIDPAYIRKGSTGPLTVHRKVPAGGIVKVSGWCDQNASECSVGWHGILVEE